MSKVLLFDCDGVLGDTERFGHLPAFNQMWQEFDVSWQWDEKQYGRKLKIGGGKERMASLFSDPEFQSIFKCPETEEGRSRLIKKWHKRKTEIYKKIIRSGQIPARPGVKRLSKEALSEGWVLGLCSTSAEESVRAVLNHAIGDEFADRFSLVLAGDIVTTKKPSPEIYNLAAKELNVSPEDCIVVEDSRNGLVAAKKAGMKCVITVNSYTRDEDFSEADIVLTCLGDPDGEKTEVLANRADIKVEKYFTVQNLEAIKAR